MQYTITIFQIIIVWGVNNEVAPTSSRFPGGQVPLSVVTRNGLSLTGRYQMHSSVTTDAVFSLDQDSNITTEEMDFAYLVWRSFPDRIVGYPARHHYWNEAKDAWTYSSRWSNSYSIVLTGSAIYHRYYQFALLNAWPQLLNIPSIPSSCDDILLNVMVSDIIQRPPIKLSQRKQYKELSSEAK